MGGALVILCLLVPTILWADPHNVFVWSTAAVTAGYGVIGYLDDYLKIKLKNSGGLPGRYKLLGQLLIGGAAIYYTFVLESRLPADWFEIRTRLAVPFTSFSRFSIELPLAVGTVGASAGRSTPSSERPNMPPRSNKANDRYRCCMPRGSCFSST